MCRQTLICLGQFFSLFSKSIPFSSQFIIILTIFRVNDSFLMHFESPFSTTKRIFETQTHDIDKKNSLTVSWERGESLICQRSDRADFILFLSVEG